MGKKETGPFRTAWNYFKRGKSEINFLLTIYNTIIIIWAGGNGKTGILVGFSLIFGFLLFLVALIVGKYSLEKVDPTVAYLNPFTQDVSRYRSLMALGMEALAIGNREGAVLKFRDAERVLSRWLND